MDRQTIVMVATRSQETEAGVANKDLYINPGQILAYNIGSICPPNLRVQAVKPNHPANLVKLVIADDWGGIGVTIVDRGPKGLTVV